MKRIASHLLARYFIALVLVFNKVPVTSQVPQGCDISLSCWVDFDPDPEWDLIHPGCSPEFTLDDECVPSAELFECSAGNGKVTVGDVMVYYESEPLALYRIISTDGIVITVLIEEF